MRLTATTQAIQNIINDQSALITELEQKLKEQPQWKEKPDCEGWWIIGLKTVTSEDWGYSVFYCKEGLIDAYARNPLTPGLEMQSYGPITPPTTERGGDSAAHISGDCESDVDSQATSPGGER